MTAAAITMIAPRTKRTEGFKLVKNGAWIAMIGAALGTEDEEHAVLRAGRR
jgi:hypothetical protein